MMNNYFELELVTINLILLVNFTKHFSFLTCIDQNAIFLPKIQFKQ